MSGGQETKRATAHLKTGGTIDVTLPLVPCRVLDTYTGHRMPVGWREDQNGILINLEAVSAIVPSVMPAERAIVGLTDGDDAYWRSVGPDLYSLGRKAAPAQSQRSQEYIAHHYGIKEIHYAE